MTPRAFYDVPAPAKLNLFLHIVGRRADGYHLLQSLFVLIDWCDLLHFERRDDGALARHDLGLPLPADDLCLRAARALQQASGTSHGVDLSIDKRLPAGAGMGGGSSDAASALLALNRLWGLHWPRERLMALGLALGADVPFFLGRGNALVEGIGERLTPLDVAPQRYAVVKPPAGLETRAVFARFAQVGKADPLENADTLAGLSGDASASADLFRRSRNDLQAAAESLGPEGSQVVAAGEWLRTRFGNSRMTGSGSAVFAHVARAGGPEGAEQEHAETRTETQPETEIADNLPPGFVGRSCMSLRAHPLADWADG